MKATTFWATREFGLGQRQNVKSFLAIREYYYLSASVSFCGIPESLTGLTQPVAPIDDWRDLSRRHEFPQNAQIRLVYFGNEDGYFLAHER
jgi:hypothetical protein